MQDYFKPGGQVFPPDQCSQLQGRAWYNDCEMEILLNGEVAAVADGITVAELMRQKLPQVQRVAVEVNFEIVLRSQHASHTLCAGDRVEIVRAIGGG